MTIGVEDRLADINGKLEDIKEVLWRNGKRTCLRNKRMNNPCRFDSYQQHHIYARVAQLAERRSYKAIVVGSSPTTCTIFTSRRQTYTSGLYIRFVSSVGRASG